MDDLVESGRVDPSVKTLQEALISLGVALPRFGADGVLGGETRHAVREWLSSEAQRVSDGARVPGWAAEAILEAALRAEAPSPGTAWETKSIDDRRRFVMKLLVEVHGLPAQSAAGVVGNLDAESSILPNRIEGSRAASPMTATDFYGQVRTFSAAEVRDRSKSQKIGPVKPGAGLAQWTSAKRRAELFLFEYGGDVLGDQILFSMEAQVAYLMSELSAKYRNLNQLLHDPATTLEDAADEFVWDFERPGSILVKNPETGRHVRRSRDDDSVQNTFAKRRAAAIRAHRAYREGSEQ